MGGGEGLFSVRHVAAKIGAGYNRLPSHTRKPEKTAISAPAYKTPAYKTIVRLVLVAVPAMHVLYLRSDSQAVSALT